MISNMSLIGKVITGLKKILPTQLLDLMSSEDFKRNEAIILKHETVPVGDRVKDPDAIQSVTKSLE